MLLHCEEHYLVARTIYDNASTAVIHDRYVAIYICACTRSKPRLYSKFYPSILQVSLYMDKFAGVCQSVLHECKLTFLQIICDHDLFVEMPGRDPSDR